MKQCVKIFIPVFSLIFLLSGLEAKEKNQTAKEANAEKGPQKLNIPIPVGHGGKGMKVPSFDTEGKKKMMFIIESAKRLDDDHLQMRNLKVEMYGDSGSDTFIDLPNSVFDLKTSVITSDDPVTIRRSDFEIKAATMVFNTQTRVGKLAGKIKMIIYNRDETVPEVKK